MAIVGTAGHVDHGKSALVTALTGTNPDRWLEERSRGMTIDLGFAQLTLEGGVEAAMIDVPGHERFVHNMLAGAGGMDVLLLVIAADEGVRLQTREHLDIARYLGATRTIVAVSKIDLVETDERDNVLARIAEQLRATPAGDASIIGVSTVSGEGLPTLRAAIAQALRDVPPRDRFAPAYLPIDRVFSRPGHGTIVTGTLMQGCIAAGDWLTLEPSGKPTRVRAIQIFGSSVPHAFGGSRVALNLSGIERDAIGRGEAAVSDGIAARSRYAVRFSPLPAAIDVLRRRTQVRVHIGSAEIMGTLILHDRPTNANEVEAEVVLREPAVAFAGTRFVVRRPSPKMLLGGGYVCGFRPAQAGERDARADVLAAVRARGPNVAGIPEIAYESNVREAVVRDALTLLATAGEVVELRKPQAYVDGVVARELRERVLERLEQAHRNESWTMGITSLTLARTLALAEPTLVRLLAVFVENGELAQRAGYYAIPGHRPVLSPQQRALFNEVIRFDPDRPCVPASFSEAAAAIRDSTIAGALRAFDTLLACGDYVHVADDLYSAEQISAIHAAVTKHFRSRDFLTPAELRDAIDSSRKHVIPLLEWLDARGVTLRADGVRVLRSPGRSDDAVAISDVPELPRR